MPTVFWDRKGILLVDFMPTINANPYCETFKKTTASHPKTGSEECFLEELCFFTTMPALTLLIQLKNCWINSDGYFFYHPPYSPDLAPSDFHLSPKLKEFLGGKRFGSDEELENPVIT